MVCLHPALLAFAPEQHVSDDAELAVFVTSCARSQTLVPVWVKQTTLGHKVPPLRARYALEVLRLGEDARYKRSLVRPFLSSVVSGNGPRSVNLQLTILTVSSDKTRPPGL